MSDTMFFQRPTGRRTHFRRAPAIIALLSLGATLLAGAPGAGAAPGQIRTAPDHRLGNDASATRGKSGETLAVDPADSNHVVEIEQDIVREECSFHVTFDGGTTWDASNAGGDFQAPAGGSPAYPTSSPGPCSVLGHGASNVDQQGVAFGSPAGVGAANATVYSVFAATRCALATSPGCTTTIGSTVLFAKSTDGGRTYSTAIEVPGMIGGTSKNPDFTFPELVVDPRTSSTTDDQIYIGAIRTSPGNSQAMVIRSDDSGSTWQAPVEASNTTVPAAAYTCTIPKDPTSCTLTATGDTNKYATEMSNPVFGPVVSGVRTLYVAWRTQKANGSSIGPGCTPTATFSCTGPPVNEEQGENVSDGYIVLAKSLDNGATWSKERVVNVQGYVYSGPVVSPYSATPTYFNASTWPRLAVDGTSGNIYMVYNQGPFLGNNSTSANQCSPWSSNATPTVFPTFPNPPKTCPAYAGGQFSAADHFIHNDQDVYFTRSVDGGTTWDNPRMVNNAPQATTGNSGIVAPEITQTRHPNITLASDGRIDIIWQDRRHWYIPTSTRTRTYQTDGTLFQNVTGRCTHTHVECPDERLGDTYYTYSTDSGVTGASNRRVNDRSQGLDVGYDYRFSTYWDYGPALVPQGTDKVLVADMDPREGNHTNSDSQDIYVRQVNLNAASGNGSILTDQVGQGNSEALSIALSQRAYPGGNEGRLVSGFASQSATRVVIVNESDWTGALAAGVLARGNVGSLLAAPASGLTQAVKNEIARIHPDGAYVIGDTAALSTQVDTDLANILGPYGKAGNIHRCTTSCNGPTVNGETPAQLAAAIATSQQDTTPTGGSVGGLDRRSSAERTTQPASGNIPAIPPLPAYDGVIIANPNTLEAATTAALAANRRLPILYVNANSVPAETTAALQSLNISSTVPAGAGGVANIIIVGDTSAVSASVATSIQTTTGITPKRLSGADLYATANAVVTESVTRGMPKNVVYASDGANPMHSALLGAEVARLGGLLLPVPGGTVANATSALATLGLAGGVDRIVTSTLSGGTFTPVTPARILDTRVPTGVCTPSPCGALGPGGTVSLQVAGQGGIPATGVSAVVMNVTVTQPTASSVLTVYPSDAPLPTASNLNFTAGQTVPNLVTVRVGADGKVNLWNAFGSVHVIADVAGWYDDGTVSPGSRFNPLPPARVLDTRVPTGVCSPSPCAAIGAGGTLGVQITGQGGVPATGVTAVVMNVTVTQPTAASVLTVYPSDAALPTASNLNYTAGQTVPNLVTVKLGADGKVNVWNAFGSVHVIADVAGWYGTAGSTAGSRLYPITPARVLDSRSGSGIGVCNPGPCATLGANGTLTLQVAGQGGVPATGATAVVLNVTVTNPTAASFLTVYPSDAVLPNASNLNYSAGQTVPNQVVVKLGADGALNLWNFQGSVDVVVDVAGWFNTSGQ
ncbi:MAG TPA: hypothetical protein VFJ85_16500 [Acidimicrobiales bacterium]|nr:hypothetical protein [Acidimicrobiales bacterium]